MVKGNDSHNRASEVRAKDLTEIKLTYIDYNKNGEKNN